MSQGDIVFIVYVIIGGLGMLYGLVSERWSKIDAFIFYHVWPLWIIYKIYIYVNINLNGNGGEK